MPYPIGTPEDRGRLKVRDKPYFDPLNDTIHLGYRKGKFKRSWVIRWKTETGYRTETVIGVAPDDADTRSDSRTLTFGQMKERIMKDRIHQCTFCGKTSKEVERLVAGPSVYICNRCNEIATHIINNPDASGTVKLDDDGRAVLDSGGEPIFEAVG